MMVVTRGPAQYNCSPRSFDTAFAGYAVHPLARTYAADIQPFAPSTPLLKSLPPPSTGAVLNSREYSLGIGAPPGYQIVAASNGSGIIGLLYVGPEPPVCPTTSDIPTTPFPRRTYSDTITPVTSNPMMLVTIVAIGIALVLGGSILWGYWKENHG